MYEKKRNTLTCGNAKARITLSPSWACMYVYGSHIELSASPILLSRLLFVNVVPCTLCDFLLPTPPSPKDLNVGYCPTFSSAYNLLGSKWLFECLGVQWSLHNVQTSVTLNWQRYNVSLLWQLVREFCVMEVWTFTRNVKLLSHVCRKFADFLHTTIRWNWICRSLCVRSSVRMWIIEWKRLSSCHLCWLPWVSSCVIQILPPGIIIWCTHLFWRLSASLWDLHRAPEVICVC
jgi:hypothetical protein